MKNRKRGEKILLGAHLTERFWTNFLRLKALWWWTIKMMMTVSRQFQRRFLYLQVISRFYPLRQFRLARKMAPFKEFPQSWLMQTLHPQEVLLCNTLPLDMMASLSYQVWSFFLFIIIISITNNGYKFLNSWSTNISTQNSKSKWNYTKRCYDFHQYYSTYSRRSFKETWTKIA